MGRPRKDDKLQDFKDWLVSDQCISNTTARVYTSCLRTLLSQIPDESNPRAVAEILLALREEKPNTYSSTRAAYVQYREYIRFFEGIELPAAPTRLETRMSGKIKGSREDILSYEERDALRALRGASMTLRDIENAKWSDVEIRTLRHRETTLVRDPSKAHQYWSIPSSVLLIFWNRAGVTDNLGVPLIPIEPGGFAPIPRRLLRLEADCYTADQIQAMMDEPPPDLPETEVVPEPEEEEPPPQPVTLADLMRFDPDAD